MIPPKQIITQVKPQEWFQEEFLSSPADIVIWWWSAWCGKTFALLMESLRHIDVPRFWFLCFRRTTPEIRNEWWLRDESNNIYPNVWALSRESVLEREFQSGAKGKFWHLEYEKDKFKYQWSQIPLIMFDELTHFTEGQFWYMVGRNRSTCGVRPYIRATCNPDPDSRVADLISWWIDQNTWYPIHERAWVIRYFTRYNNQLLRADSKEELYNQYPQLFDKDNYRNEIKSLTFIPWSIYQNRILLTKDPWYLANLKTQDEIQRARLLDGNWKVRSDWLGLYDRDKLWDMFSNQIDYKDGRKCITSDVARFGADLAVIISWIWWYGARIDIWTKSSIELLHQIIEDRKKEYNIWSSDVLCDEDGVWWWLVDKWYKGFKNWDPALNKENYENLKTQCYYKLQWFIKDNLISINSDNIYVDGHKTNQIIINSKTYYIPDLIKKQLSSIKRKDTDKDGKLKINTKEEQKAILWWMSPDIWDSIMMRTWFDLDPRKNKRITII